MKNSTEIKAKFEKLLNQQELASFINNLPGLENLSPESKVTAIKVIEGFLQKVIKKLDNKSFSKSTINTFLGSTLLRLIREGTHGDIYDCFQKVVEKILTENIPGFFDRRLNVKSKEFMALPDWDPSQE